MLFLLSPAKSLDYDTPTPPAVARKATEPAFMDRAAELIHHLQPLAPAEVAELMSLSDSLAALNVARYAAWAPRSTAANSKPAVLAFNGDVYEGLQATSLSVEDLTWAQQHVVILSGLYGALRPLDRLQPYRLEMGTRLATPQGKDLYAYWGDTLAQYLNERAARQKASAIVNLASQEYFKAADRPVLERPVVECVFQEWRGGAWKIVSFSAKRARGLMARHAIVNRLTSPEQLLSFNAEGYACDESASTPSRLVFRRRLND